MNCPGVANHMHALQIHFSSFQIFLMFFVDSYQQPFFNHKLNKFNNFQIHSQVKGDSPSSSFFLLLFKIWSWTNSILNYAAMYKEDFSNLFCGFVPAQFSIRILSISVMFSTSITHCKEDSPFSFCRFCKYFSINIMLKKLFLGV